MSINDLPCILAETRTLYDAHAATTSVSAAALRDRAKAARDAYAATIPRRVRDWDSPEGERVTAMKTRLFHMTDLVNRLGALAKAHKILDDSLCQLEK